MNIAEILKDASQGTKLYSPIFGECELAEITNDHEYPIKVTAGDGHRESFTEDGKYYSNEDFINTECLLFPSKENRNWNKFLIISPGDVIVSPHGVLYLMRDNKTIIFTYDLNIKSGGYGIKDLIVDNYRKATSKEIKQIFDFMKQQGFKYNPTNISIKSKNKEYHFKPFEKVLVRDGIDEEWRCNFYSHKESNSENPYRCVYSEFKYCIPYIGNEHLLGTSDNI